ncbi:MAG: AAA family ATPase [Paludibacteraceae bacterium]
MNKITYTKTTNKDITLTISQQRVFDDLCTFVKSSRERVFILKGYAGTGKTTMMRFLVKWLNEERKRFKLIAPTGRAAKVLRDLSGSEASTIHSMLYTYKDFNEDVSEVQTKADSTGQLYMVFEPIKLDVEETPETIYIIDESSMVADVAPQKITQAQFGSGRVLTELLNYDQRPKSKFIFIGDPCQLPPVMETSSPALSVDYFKGKNMLATERQLTEIIRQSEENSIVKASQRIRGFYSSAPETEAIYGNSVVWGRKLPFSGGSNIIIHANKEEMLRDYLQCIEGKNYNAATYLCRGNKTCDQNSYEIRRRLGFGKSVLEKGDLLLVIQNNMISGLINGDMIEVIEVSSKTWEKACLTFRQVKVRELTNNIEYTQLLIENTITQNTLNLDGQQQTALFVDFCIRMKEKGISAKKDKDTFDSYLRKDPYLNALRTTYGYAVTCHKAQGGEWDDVYVDIPRNITKNPTKSSYQWVYTSMTRAKKRLHVVNDFFIE